MLKALGGPSAKGWPEAVALARLHCDVCPNGFYDEALIQHLSRSSFRLFEQAVRSDQLTEASANAAAEKRREYRKLLAQPDANAVLHCAVKSALADEVTIRTPCCARPFAEMEGCCAIECNDCQTFFCGLCLEGSWNRDQAHRHVEACPSKPVGMTSYFLPLHEWKHHIELRQRRVVQDWISARPDLPDIVKRRLLDEDFPPPKPLAA